MNTEELNEIFNALNRINRSLDERFTKDADFYIEQEQIEVLKDLIYRGEYDKIAENFNSRVVLNWIVKNAWLIKNENYAVLQKIFDDCPDDYLKIIMSQDFFDNKIEMPASFRFWLLSNYLKRLNEKACSDMLQDNLTFLNQPTLKAICVAQILKNKSIEERYKIFNEYSIQSPNLLSQEKIFAQIFSKLNDAVRNFIFENHFAKETPASKFWADILSAEDIPFMMEKFKRYCQTHSSNLDACKDVDVRLFWISTKNFPVYAKGFAAACSCMIRTKNINLQKALAIYELNHFSKREQEKNQLKAELAKVGITDIEGGGLFNFDEIKERLNYHGANSEKLLSDNVYRFLAVSFKKTCASEDLKKLFREVKYRERFEKLCCLLIKFTDSNYQLNFDYINCMVQIIPQETNKYNPLVSYLLDFIANNNILRRYKNFGTYNIEKFFREKDFGRFVKIAHF